MLDHEEWGPGLDLTDKKKFGGSNIHNDYPFFLILNLAIGGNYFGVWGPDNKGPDKKGKNELYDFGLFPQLMHIDWVRVDGQEGADQPATAPGTKSEGNKNPNPESDGRSR